VDVPDTDRAAREPAGDRRQPRAWRRSHSRRR
jgi:hypothetical protein